MGQAIFIADDPAGVTEGQLSTLVDQLRSVTAWNVGPNGEVVIEYREGDIAVETIEEALAGLGYRVQPVADDPDAGDAEPRNRGTTLG